MNSKLTALKNRIRRTKTSAPQPIAPSQIVAIFEAAAQETGCTLISTTVYYN